jgi:hypothetical protein
MHPLKEQVENGNGSEEVVHVCLSSKNESHAFTSGSYPFSKQQLLTVNKQHQCLRSRSNNAVGDNEVISFVLDASFTMKAPLDEVNKQKQTTGSTNYSNSDTSSRLSLAKSIVLDTIASYIRDQTDKNIDCIIFVVCTKDTYHHLLAHIKIVPTLVVYLKC